MCGIAGLLAAPGDVRPMIDALAHRGPDGIRTETVWGASLAHARLSIIDLEGGWQPLHADGVTVVGNGEIYNYVELIEAYDLSADLATGSDFEPLLHLFAKEGPAAFARLRGMYAFCLVDGEGSAWLARDPFGIKPLYLIEHEGGLAFASEPRAFVAAGLLTAAQDDQAAEDLLGLSYVPGQRTVLAGVRRLAPGEVLRVRDGRIVEQQLTPPLTVGKGAGGAARSVRSAGRDLVGELDRVLEDSVLVHQRSDAPYGLFLSGGVDSATIATLMSRLNARPVTAFTCGFETPGARDERGGAEAVARALNLDWRETSFGEDDFWRIAPQVARTMDDPTADYAALPTWKLAEAARRDLTVVLTGEGGDELFGGYGRYRRALRPAWLGGRSAEPRPGDARVLARWREIAKPPNGLSRLQQAQWGDVATWLPADLLLKLDRCLMAHGLEGRTPFLDREVAAFAFALPDRCKVRGRYGKWLLRRWLERACPAASPWARKQGFTVPVDAWIAPRAADIAPRVARIEAIRRVREPEAVLAAFSPDARGQAWPLLFHALWALIHLEGASPTEALAAVAGPI